MLSHRAIAADVAAACSLVLYTEDDVMLSVLPLHHVYEAVAGVFCPLLRGSTVAFCAATKRLSDCLKLFAPTVMVLVPLYLETFVKRIWDNAAKQRKTGRLRFGIRLGNGLAAIGIDMRRKLFADIHGFFGGRLATIVSGGAYLNPALVRQFREFGITVLQGYGTTECAPIVSVSRRHNRKDRSVGSVLPCCSVRIDRDGQILVRGSNVMNGYLDDPAATDDAMSGGWYLTGDLGYVDSDGSLYVTGRMGDMIVLKNGKNIMPREIEMLILQSPLVQEVVVKASGADVGGIESLAAIIYPVQTQTQYMDKYELRHVIAQEIDKVNQRLAYYKRIKEFTLRDSAFPKTTTQKIMRYKI
jgi:long-chain acyl-CoA synthetase